MHLLLPPSIMCFAHRNSCRGLSVGTLCTEYGWSPLHSTYNVGNTIYYLRTTWFRGPGKLGAYFVHGGLTASSSASAFSLNNCSDMSNLRLRHLLLCAIVLMMPHDAPMTSCVATSISATLIDPSTIPILHMASSNTTTCPHAQPPWYQHKGLPPCSSNLIALHSSHSDRDTSTAKTVGGYQFTTFDFSPISSFVLLSLCLRRDVRVLHIYNCFGRI
jgi:hypothetical protein